MFLAFLLSDNDFASGNEVISYYVIRDFLAFGYNDVCFFAGSFITYIIIMSLQPVVTVFSALKKA